MECHFGGHLGRLTNYTYAILEAWPTILGVWCKKMQEESLMVLGGYTEWGLVCLLYCNPNNIITESTTPLICVRPVTHTWATVSFDSFLQDAASYFKRVFLYTHESVLAFFLSISILQVVIIVMMHQVNHPVVLVFGEKVQMHRQQACSLIYVPYSLVFNIQELK